MSAILNPLQPPPSAVGKYDPDDARRHRNHSAELQGRLMAIETLLAPYLDTFFDTADGQRLSALARPFGRAAGISAPFAGLPGSDTGSVKISANSTLLQTVDPTDQIFISGLDDDMRLGSGSRVWLHIDLSGTLEEGGEIFAWIDWGSAWGGNFPIPVNWDTGDGLGPTTTGDRDGAATAGQTDIYIPIGYVDGSENPIVAAGNGIPLGGGLFFVQQLTTHLVLGQACVNGDNVTFALPLYGAQPDTGGGFFGGDLSTGGGFGTGGLSSGGLSTGGLTTGGLSTGGLTTGGL